MERCLPRIKLCPGQIKPYAGLIEPQPLLLKSEEWHIKPHALRLKRQEEQIRAKPQLFLPIIQRLRPGVNRFLLNFAGRAAAF